MGRVTEREEEKNNNLEKAIRKKSEKGACFKEVMSGLKSSSKILARIYSVTAGRDLMSQNSGRTLLVPKILCTAAQKKRRKKLQKLPKRYLDRDLGKVVFRKVFDSSSTLIL